MPMTEPWSYPSIIGMLLYLSTNTCPDIAFAVSQAARFTHERSLAVSCICGQDYCPLSQEDFGKWNHCS